MARATAPQGRVVTVSWVTTARLEHDPEKACRGLDPGWKPIFRNAPFSTKESKRESFHAETIAL
jgi:hypothetical protein